MAFATRLLIPETCLSKAADADLAVHEEVGLLLVRHEGLLVWSVEDGIALGVTRDMPVIVEKETDLSWMIGLIRHHNMTQENVIMEIHNIAEDQLDL